MSEQLCPLLAIIGQTASGKTALAIKLAQHFDGEIIAADSRTVYKGMDIATAKPTAAERAAVPHHLLDITTPDEPLNVADFQRLAMQAITDISARGRLPIIVGGSGLYIDAVLFNYQFPELQQAPDPAIRNSLVSKSIAELQAMVTARGLELPQNSLNKRHLINSIERGAAGNRHVLRANTLVLGLKRERQDLEKRITARVKQMFDEGLLAEANTLRAKYVPDIDPLKTPGYKTLWQLLDGEITQLQAQAAFVRADLILAKKQYTWFKRNKSIHWLHNRDNFAESVELVTTVLHK